MSAISSHWDEIFKKTETDKLGWFEEDAAQTMKLLNKIPELREKTIFVPGVGTSILIDDLIQANARLILNDISADAISKAKKKYNGRNANITWLCQDISEPLPPDMKNIDIWIDRAVLHFLTKEVKIKQYFQNLLSVVNVDGYALFAEFSKVGAAMCAGLNVKRYSLEELSKELSNFELITSEEYTYYNPRGDKRPYIYALFKRVQINRKILL